MLFYTDCVIGINRVPLSDSPSHCRYDTTAWPVHEKTDIVSRAHSLQRIHPIPDAESFDQPVPVHSHLRKVSYCLLHFSQR